MLIKPFILLQLEMFLLVDDKLTGSQFNENDKFHDLVCTCLDKR